MIILFFLERYTFIWHEKVNFHYGDRGKRMSINFHRKISPTFPLDKWVGGRFHLVESTKRQEISAIPTFQPIILNALLQAAYNIVGMH